MDVARSALHRWAAWLATGTASAGSKGGEAAARRYVRRTSVRVEWEGEVTRRGLWVSWECVGMAQRGLRMYKWVWGKRRHHRAGLGCTPSNMCTLLMLLLMEWGRDRGLRYAGSGGSAAPPQPTPHTPPHRHLVSPLPPSQAHPAALQQRPAATQEPLRAHTCPAESRALSGTSCPQGESCSTVGERQGGRQKMGCEGGWHPALKAIHEAAGKLRSSGATLAGRSSCSRQLPGS
jgi:hypothetical protein